MPVAVIAGDADDVEVCTNSLKEVNESKTV